MSSSKVRHSCNTNTYFSHSPGYEEESPAENYYSRDYDEYSPSPPHASGGSYFPQGNEFPPPPANPGFMHHSNQSTPNVAQPPIPPYNPADYPGPPPAAVPPNSMPNPNPNPNDPYGYPPQPRGDNVSSDTENHNHIPLDRQAGDVNVDVPYFPPPPRSPGASI